MKKTTNTQPIEPMDERQKQITGKAIVFGFLFLVVCLLIATIYRIVTSAEAGWELFAIVGASFVIIIARWIMGDIEQPLDHKNRPLPTGNTKPEKRIRCKNYAVGSVLFGAAFGVMDILLLAFGENEVSEKELAELIFPNLNKGLTIAEVELESEDESYEKPDFIGEEVTGDVRYYNSFLMKIPFTRW